MPGANIFHLHIPKTAGSSLRSAFHHNNYKMLPVEAGFVYDAQKHGEVDLFSGHVGLRTVQASPAFQGKVVTILRDPYERVFSYYHHLILLHDQGSEVSERTQLAAKYDLRAFLALKDDAHLLSDIYNTMTWLMVHDAGLMQRKIFRLGQPPLSDADLVARAKANLSSCLVVGLQDRMDLFARRLKQATGFAAPIAKENANLARPPLEALDAETRRRMRGWIEMDLEVYEWALAEFGRD